MNRANFIGAPEYFNLNMACLSVAEAFGHCIYLVGSSLSRRDFRDVDVRCILDDEAYARLFPGMPCGGGHDAMWTLMCASISTWLSQQSGLLVDFQIQRRTDANGPDNQDENGKVLRRHPLGFFVNRAETP